MEFCKKLRIRRNCHYLKYCERKYCLFVFPHIYCYRTIQIIFEKLIFASSALTFFIQLLKNSITINSARWRRSSWYFQEEFPSFQVHLLLHHSACQAPSLLMAKNLTSISYRMQSRTTMCNLQFLASCSLSSSMEGHQRLPLPQVPQSLRWIPNAKFV